MLSQTLDWIAAHPFVTGVALVVSLALALIYGAVIYVAIGRMRPDYFVRDETSSSAWRRCPCSARCPSRCCAERIAVAAGPTASAR